MTDMILDYLSKGGGVMYMLLIACFMILHTGIGKWLQYRRYFREKTEQLPGDGSPDSAAPAPVEIVLPVQRDWFYDEYIRLKEVINTDGIYMRENVLREILLYHIPRLEKGLDSMAAWVSVAPLLGLLGTVIGMIQTFKMIMIFGVGDPAVMSEGISVALLTTQAGLLVAFPGLIILNYLKRKKEVIIDGLLADYDEIISENCDYSGGS